MDYLFLSWQLPTQGAVLCIIILNNFAVGLVSMNKDYIAYSTKTFPVPEQAIPTNGE